MKHCPSCARTSRREWLSTAAGWAALNSIVRSGNAQVSSGGARARNTARACLFINLNGAPSQLDTFDPKDNSWNPTDIDIQDYAGGIRLSRRLFPNLSRFTSDLLVMRSVSSWEAEHGRGQFYMQTAHPSNPAFIQETPHIGAVVATEKGGDGKLPPFLSLNGGASQGATFLGGRMEPLAAPSASAGGLSTIEHNFFGAQSQARFEERYRLLDDLDAATRAVAIDKAVTDHASFYSAAKAMMYDPAIASVFRSAGDDGPRYGTNSFGQSMVVARNAIRARNGTVFVTVNQGNWDMHQNMFDPNYSPNMYTTANELDRGLGALIEDLKSSGDFDSTLIVIMGEFGRTPGPLNARGGRDHHKSAMSVAMLGGGVRGGRVIGATDGNGDQVTDPGWRKNRAIYVEDIISTIYSALGVDWTKSITDTPSGRRFEYVPYAGEGRFTSVDEVFG